jgi:hypothetical protein
MNDISFSSALLSRVRDAKRELMSIDGRRIEVVTKNLAFLHDAVVASEQLLLEAAQSVDLLPDEPFRSRLSEYYRSHLEEERGHVTWLRCDLESVGVRPGVPNQYAMEMVGTQYYLLKHVHPAALLGYLAVVEGDPVPLAVVDSLEGLHGTTLFRFVRFHATKDLEHRIELFEVMDAAPESAKQIVAESAESVLAKLSEATVQWTHQQ